MEFIETITHTHFTGDLYFLDPALVFYSENMARVWHDICDFLQNNTGGLLTIQGSTLLIGTTTKDYPEVGTDSETFCFITKNDLLKLNPQFNEHDLAMIFNDFDGVASVLYRDDDNEFEVSGTHDFRFEVGK